MLTKTKTTIIVLISFLFVHGAYGADTGTIKKYLQKIIASEKNTYHKRKILNIKKNCQTTYGNLKSKLEKNQKIIIFIDPPHGKLKDGTWQGSVTGRLSSTGKPEEYYSMMLSREFYRVFSQNKFIAIKSTDDFLKVMQGKSSSYKKINFHQTVKKAAKHNSFILMSQHLNNVSYFKKAFGHSNMKGIHIVKDYYGRYVLRYFPYEYKGFLSLYNVFDSTGFSGHFARLYRNNMVHKNFHANNWQKGAVADDRFSYFYNYPMGIIFESGFISNPHEEKKLNNPAYIEKIIKTQYETFLQTFHSITGLDISGEILKSENYQKDLWMHAALNQIALYYIKSGNTYKSKIAIKYILKSSKNHTAKKYYRKLLRRINSAHWAFKKALIYKKKSKRTKRNRSKRYYKRLHRKYLWRSYKKVKSKPVLYAFRKKYYKKLNIKRKSSTKKK